MDSKNDNPYPPDRENVFPKVPLKKEPVTTRREGTASGGTGVFSVFPDESFPSPEQLKDYEARP